MVVHEHYKLVYYINEAKDRIVIADLWDTRQEPRQLANMGTMHLPLPPTEALNGCREQISTPMSTSLYCSCATWRDGSIFDLIMMNGELTEVRAREKKGAEPLPEKDKRTAEEFIRKYHKNIIDKWVKFFILKQAVRSTNIKKKYRRNRYG